jgi:Family of unknown function (DUF6491)
MRKSILLATGLLLVTAGPALAQGSTCLRYDNIYSWKALNDKTLIVEDTLHNRFKLSLMGYCPNLKFKEQLAFKSFGGTQLSCVTKGDSVYTRDFGSHVPYNCPIADVVPYTPAMQKADEAAAAAKKAEENNSH